MGQEINEINIYLNKKMYLDYFNNRRNDALLEMQGSPNAQSENIYELIDKVIANDITSTAGFYYILLGAKGLQFILDIDPNKPYPIDISSTHNEYCIASYFISSLNPTNNRHIEVYPLVFQDKNSPEHKLYVFSLPENKDKVPASYKMELHLYIINKERIKDPLLRALVRMFTAFNDNNFHHMILLGHIVCELSIKHFVSKLIKDDRCCKYKEFINNTKKNKSFSYLSTVFIPTLAKIFNKPILPSNILKDLEKLIKLRNTITHTLQPETIKKDVARKLLIATFIAYKYFDLMIPIKDYSDEELEKDINSRKSLAGKAKRPLSFYIDEDLPYYMQDHYL